MSDVLEQKMGEGKYNPAKRYDDEINQDYDDRELSNQIDDNELTKTKKKKKYYYYPEYQKRWNKKKLLEDPDYFKRLDKRRYKRHREKRLAAVRKWRKKNRHLVAARLAVKIFTSRASIF
jgi:hypothetical protein